MSKHLNDSFTETISKLKSGQQHEERGLAVQKGSLKFEKRQQ